MTYDFQRHSTAVSSIPPIAEAEDAPKDLAHLVDLQLKSTLNRWKIKKRRMSGL